MERHAIWLAKKQADEKLATSTRAGWRRLSRVGDTASSIPGDRGKRSDRIYRRVGFSTELSIDSGKERAILSI
jgi:hypothetical protein